MHRWSKCPGSIALSKDQPNKSSKYAQEGTHAHDFAEKILQRELSLLSKKEYEKWYNDQTFPEDMEEAVNVYTKYILDELVFKHEKSFIELEKKFDLSQVFPGCYGTADCVSYDFENKILYVVDYKHGAGLPVEVKNNSQLKYYALGALLSTKVGCIAVKVVVVQPRCFHPDGPIRVESLDPIELLEFSADLYDYAKKTLDPKAKLEAGDWCRFCPANRICPLIVTKANEMAKIDFKDKNLIGNRTISEVLEWLPTFESWIKNVREFAYNEALQGRTPKHYKLVNKRPSRKWVVNDDDVEFFLQDNFLMDDEAIYTKKINTPAQIEKLLGKDLHQELNTIVKKESSGTVLVHESDKRETYKNDPKLDFEKIGE